MYKRTKKSYVSNVRHLIIEHIKNNASIYFSIIIIFFIGICIGVIIFNHSEDNNKEQIYNYINESIEKIKDGTLVKKSDIIKHSFIKNVYILIAIWFVSLTLFGKHLLYLITLILGISFGFSTSAIMICFGIPQGMLFFICTILPQNIIAIPSFFYLIAKGIYYHLKIYSYNNINNTIKNNLFKYTFNTLILLIFLYISSIIECYFSYGVVIKNISNFL